MSSIINCRSDVYRELDSIIGKASSVIFGSGAISRLPLSELINFFGLNISVCDRSLEQMDIADAPAHLDECIFGLRPDKIFLYFGDDCGCPGFDREGFLRAYEKLIDEIAARCDSTIYILSVLSDSAAAGQLNRQLSILARDNGCEYIDTSDCVTGERGMLRLFKKLSRYMRDSRISFPDAMKLAGI